MYDTLEMTNRMMREGGMDRKSAEAQAKIIRDSYSGLATKKDLENLENRLVARLGSMLVMVCGGFASVLLFVKFFMS